MLRISTWVAQAQEVDSGEDWSAALQQDAHVTVNWHWIITEIKEKQEEKPQQAQVQLPYNLHYFDPAWGDITVAVTRDYVSEREVVGERDLKYIAYFARNRGNIEVSQPYLDKGYWRVQVSTKNGANAFSSISRRFGTEPQNTFGSFFKDKVQAQQFYAAVMAAAAGS